MTGFEDAWAVARTVTGWFTREQAALLYATAAALPDGATAVEIGSYEGRSTVLLAGAVGEHGGRVVAVDPFVEDWKFGAAGTRQRFDANLARAGVAGAVEVVDDFSQRVRPGWTRPIDLLHIDGKHDYWSFTDDLRWTVHLPPGAPVLVHDCYSSVGVTLGVLTRVLPSRALRYEGRVGSMAVFRVGRPTARDRLRITSEIPWWLRNVGVKVLLRARLHGLARAAGHDSPYDPY